MKQGFWYYGALVNAWSSATCLALNGFLVSRPELEMKQGLSACAFALIAIALKRPTPAQPGGAA